MNTITRVSDVMTKQFTLVEGKETLSVGLERMKQSNSRIMIVNKRHDDDEYGFICMRDIADKVLEENKSPERTNLYDIMTKPIVTVKVSMNIRYCARLMSRLNMVLIPVCDENNIIIGVVGFDDIICKGLTPDSTPDLE
ncbi:MAG: CBS domain-containing protein [Thiotrichaceae bacterium]|nr:CBS domain-containing protein [Thiotrichaceae bacterium]